MAPCFLQQVFFLFFSFTYLKYECKCKRTLKENVNQVINCLKFEWMRNFEITDCGMWLMILSWVKTYVYYCVLERTSVWTSSYLSTAFFCLLFSEPSHPHPSSKVVYEWPQIQTKTMSDTCLKASLEMFWKKLNFKAEPLDRFDDK